MRGWHVLQRLFYALVLTGCWQAATAHHSPVAFDTDVTDFTLEGEIISVDVRNPHSAMTLRVTNDDGSTTDWDLEFSSINLLLRRGWDFDRLVVSDQVKATGNPSAVGKPEMYM